MNISGISQEIITIVYIYLYDNLNSMLSALLEDDVDILNICCDVNSKLPRI